MIIKILLIAAGVGIAVLLLRERVPGQRQALRRGVGVLVVITGIIAVLWPELTTSVANLIGVGRGTDLVLYVLVIVFAYQALATAQRIHRLEHEITVLTREIALARPAVPRHEDPRTDLLGAATAGRSARGSLRTPENP